MPPEPCYNTFVTETTTQMTLPEFQYPHQNAAYLERLCRRILESQEQETYLPILNQTIPPTTERSF